MSDDDGGQAFPRAGALGDGWEGMSLRDYFAGQALAGWIASFTESTRKSEADSTVAAMVAYQYADAMLKERAK